MKNNSGFTLVELSIVIIIIGLITGGVLGATSLIESSKRSNIIKQINSMKTGLNAFLLEYDKLPGTLNDGYSYFGSSCGSNNTNAYGGCNSVPLDNKCIDASISATCAVGTIIYRDVKRFFAHMNLSGIMPDLPFVSSTVAATNCAEILPKSPFEGYYMVSSEVPNKTFMYYFNPPTFNHNGAACVIGGFNGIINPKNAKHIDKKMDNGNGRTGYIRAISNPTNDGFDGVDCIDANGVYNVSNTSSSCGIRAEIQ